MMLIPCVLLAVGLVLLPKIGFIGETEWRQVAIVLGVSVLIVSAGWFLGRMGQTWDTEIMNGKVASKAQEEVSCNHSYQCRCKEICSTDSKGKKSCSNSCDTCYEHTNDYDWNLKTTVGKITIDRVDSQGVREPQRFTMAKIGDPAAATHLHTNWVRGAPNSLFRDRGAALLALPVPDYPNEVHDYHYVNRALTVGVPVPDLAAWNLAIANSLRDLGPQKEVNFVIVFANTPDPTYSTMIENKWLGGKKNDVVVVLGTPQYPTIQWARVVSWTDNQEFKVGLRDRLMELGKAEVGPVMEVLTKEVSSRYSRKHMKDFEYLSSEVEIATWVMVTTLVLSLLPGAALMFGVFNSGNTYRRRRFN